MGRRPSAPSSQSSQVSSFFYPRPGHSRGQEGGGSTELFAAVSFGRSRSGAPLDRRLFSAEDANSPWTFSDLVEPSPSRVDHLMFCLSLEGTPDQPLC